ncbi:hypothetical protein ABH927_005266 [Planotetraspora sp. GP83]
MSADIEARDLDRDSARLGQGSERRCLSEGLVSVIQASEATDDREDAAVARKKPQASDRELVATLVDQARAEGLELVGENGLLGRLTKLVLESALEGEITDHLGYDKHDRGASQTGNARNGTRTKTVITDVGPVEISVARDRDASFEPKIVAKRQRRLSGVDEMVISLAAKGLTTGEISAHLAEVYGAVRNGEIGQAKEHGQSSCRMHLPLLRAGARARHAKPQMPVSWTDAIIGRRSPSTLDLGSLENSHHPQVAGHLLSFHGNKVRIGSVYPGSAPSILTIMRSTRSARYACSTSPTSPKVPLGPRRFPQPADRPRSHDVRTPSALLLHRNLTFCARDALQIKLRPSSF